MSIHVPSLGEPLRVTWGAEVANRLNSMRSVGGSQLSQETPNGSGTLPLPANARDRRGASSSDISCFRLSTITVGSGDAAHVHLALKNCYFKSGAKLVSMNDQDLDGLMPKLGLICLKVYTNGSQTPPEIVAFDGDGESPATSLAAADFANPAYELHPLYFRSWSEDEYSEVTVGPITVDFRNAIIAQQWEVLP